MPMRASDTGIPPPRQTDSVTADVTLPNGTAVVVCGLNSRDYANLSATSAHILLKFTIATVACGTHRAWRIMPAIEGLMMSVPKSRNLICNHSPTAAGRRQDLLGQKGCVIWLTGLSGSGKSTIAYALEKDLMASGQLAYVLDGDNVRQGLNSDLGFSPADRDENIRRAGEAAALMADAGLIVITAFISPYRAARLRARRAAGKHLFMEVLLDVPVDVCRRRDPKGLYAKAAAGKVRQMTGVAAPYQRPSRPDIALQTNLLGVKQCVQAIVGELVRRRVLRRPS
jgi:adenylylsulfate kinase